MKTSFKTIDIKAKTWLDKVNGNSYFAAAYGYNLCLEQMKVMALKSIDIKIHGTH